MKFYVYQIKSPVLKPYIQYILFNHCNDKSFTGTIRSFANTNFCLGILKDKQLQKTGVNQYGLIEKPGINSYLTGIYLESFNLFAKGEHDEICIDFTPLGVYHFFKFRATTFLLNDDILTELFGNLSKDLFGNIFREMSLEKRGELIEDFLKTRLFNFSNSRLFEAVSIIHHLNGNIFVDALAKDMKCSNRTLHRLFINYFDISPKDYMRVVRFRKALSLITKGENKFYSHTYETEFTDQSHFIKEMKYFTGNTPKNISKSIHNIQDRVLVELQ